MKEAWGFIAVAITLALAVLYFKLRWHFKWQASRVLPPRFGQIWMSPSGRALFVLGLSTKMGDMSPHVIFSDRDPRPGKAVAHFTYSMKEWKQMIDTERLIHEGDWS